MMIKGTTYKKLLALLLFSLMITGCSSIKDGVSYRTAKSSKLLRQLKRNNDKGILIGHQDGLAYGIGWRHKDGATLDSDVYRATGQYPAVIGWDIGKVGNDNNLDSVPFNRIRELIRRGHKKGTINTISWHISLLNDSISSWDSPKGLLNSLLPNGKNHQALVEKLDKASEFLASLKTEKGKPIPFIFRPWHEMDGDWFWWGSAHTTIEDYKELFRFTIDYLKNKKGLNNFLVAYSPDRKFYSEEEYLRFYPGDEYIDILGADNYYDYTTEGDGLEAIAKKLAIVTNLAEKKGKIAAFTETGSDKVEDPFWFTQKLGEILNFRNLKSKLAYVLLWRNRDKEHFYVPYKGHKTFQDFINFTKQEDVLLLKK